jgi:hypothetical protein
MDTKLKVLCILKKRLEDAIKTDCGDEYMCNVLSGITNPELEPSAIELMEKIQSEINGHSTFGIWLRRTLNMDTHSDLGDWAFGDSQILNMCRLAWVDRMIDAYTRPKLQP